MIELLLNINSTANFVCTGFWFTLILFWIWSWFKSMPSIISKHKTTAFRIFAFAGIIRFLSLTVPLTFELASNLFFNFEYEQYTIINRAMGPYGWAYWLMILSHFISIFLSQLFWFKKNHQKMTLIFLALLFENGFSIYEKLVILITSLHRDYLVSTFSLQISSGLFFTITVSMLVFMSITLIVEYIRAFIKKNHELPNKA